jgi:gas vesicle protein GvpK
VKRRATAPRKRQPKTAQPKTALAAEPRQVTAAQLRALRREIERRMLPAAGASAGARRQSRHAGRGGLSKIAARGKGKGKARETGMRWNPDPEDVQRSVAQLVLTIVEFLRRLMERQAIRRMEQKTLTREETEAVGLALMKLEETVREIGNRFGLAAEDLNLDLGSLKLM